MGQEMEEAWSYIEAYFGVDEPQQRVLIWLKDTPNSDDLRELLKTEVFVSEFWLTFARMFERMLQD